MGKLRKGYALLLIVVLTTITGCTGDGFKNITDKTNENNSRALASGIIKENNTDFEVFGFENGKIYLYAFSDNDKDEYIKKDETYYLDKNGVLNVTSENISKENMIDELVFQNLTESHNIKNMESFNEEDILPKSILDGSAIKLNSLNSEERITSIDYIIGNDNFYIYKIFQNDKQELAIINKNTKEFYISELLDLGRENTEYRNIQSVFYDKETDCIYGVNPDGKIKKLVLENKKIKIEDYDKIRTSKDEYVNKFIKSDENNYVELVKSDGEGSSIYVSKIVKYNAKSKDYINIYKDSKYNNINTLNYIDGFFLLSVGSENKDYYLCRFKEDGIEKIRKISEDNVDENSNTYMYTNKKNNLVFVKKDYFGSDEKRVQEFRIYNIYD